MNISDQCATPSIFPSRSRKLFVLACLDIYFFFKGYILVFVLPLFQIIRHFGFSRFITFAMHLDCFSRYSRRMEAAA
jgi:hypothetical protein